ncbi:hypothetical protein HA402_000353 [Bradysia odoriphaga]|nr:hypothetical protein HA402_000353 [Bradysia odoriphaga]
MFCTNSVLLSVFVFVIFRIVGSEVKEDSLDRVCASNQRCIPASDCTTLNYNFTSLTERDRSLYLNSSACNEAEQLICCSSFTSETDAPDICGENPDYEKIYNGYDTDLQDYRWMVLLEYTSPNTTNITYQCAGSLINNRYVLTAAHCLTKKDKLTQVHLGKYNSNAHENCIKDECVHPTVTVGIDDIIIHENYSATTKLNDIALIRLSTVVYYTDFIQPICLPSTLGLMPDDAARVISGWGRGARNSNKQMLPIPRNNFTVCAEKYRRRLNIHIDEATQMCAGDIPNQGPCAGDSGGPLMTVVRNKYAIEGIISSGYNICDLNKNVSYPIIFTKVAAFEPWIKMKIRP